jgi:hypothetical protein
MYVCMYVCMSVYVYMRVQRYACKYVYMWTYNKVRCCKEPENKNFLADIYFFLGQVALFTSGLTL